MNTELYHVRLESKFALPLSDCQSTSLISEKMILSRVIALLGSCRPSTVLREISKIIITSIKSHFRRTASHVLQKLLIVCSPLRANGNSASTVILVVFAPCIEASRFHFTPSSILTTLFFPVCFAVSLIAPNDRFALGATTAFCMSRLQPRSVNRSNFATVTTANPTYARSINRTLEHR